MNDEEHNNNNFTDNIKMPPKVKRVYEGSNERTETFYGVQLARSKDVLEWPYKTPSAEFMGKSGFYFTPTKKFKDRVTCFYCKKTQSNWKDVKDPGAYHLEASRDCSFSKLLHLSKERSSNPQFDWSEVEIFKDPMCKEAIQIRQETFGKSWPHDKVGGSNPVSENMVNAGFYYSPLDSGDDLAICVYCGVSLEGWEFDDDPLFEHQKRSKDCYFLNCLEKGDISRASLKRSSSMVVHEELSVEKKVEDSISIKSGGHSIRTKRERKVLRDLSSEESQENDDSNDESFGITANDEELNDDDYIEGSKHKTSRTISLKKSSQPKSSASPSKKSKILDSSFDNDMFSNTKTKKLEIPPVTKLLTESPIKTISKEEITKKYESPHTIGEKASSPLRSFSKPPLSDITNISKASPKKQNVVVYPESDEENSIILISNSKENIGQESSTSEKDQSWKSSREVPISKEEPRDTHSPTRSSQSAEQEPVHSNDLDQHSTDSKPSKDLGSGEMIHINEKTDLTKQPSLEEQSSEKSGNKSILQSISRFFKSPQLHRSQSPFLDADYKGSDHIEDSNQIIGPNDTPIEESTDHHIQLPLDALKQFSPEKDSNTILPDADPSPELESSSSNYLSVENAETDYWMPTDTNKLFEKLEPLDTARNYLKELKDLDYDLNDDVDGRISYFINEMPENELEMTISEWILYSAQQGKKHIEETCGKMLEQFDEECDRALQKLNRLSAD